MYLFDIAMTFTNPCTRVLLTDGKRIIFNGTAHQLLDFPGVETIRVLNVNIESIPAVLTILSD